MECNKVILERLTVHTWSSIRIRNACNMLTVIYRIKVLLYCPTEGIDLNLSTGLIGNRLTRNLLEKKRTLDVTVGSRIVEGA